MFADSRNLGIVGDGGAAVSSSDSVLSAQTGFEVIFSGSYRADGMITEEWKKSGAQFDGIVTGFMSDHRQIGEVNHFLDLFHKEGTFLLVDPVLGDNGKRFSVFDGLFQKEMKQLVKRADIVTPNVTELCLLTDYDYDKIQNISETGDREALFRKCRKRQADFWTVAYRK